VRHGRVRGPRERARQEAARRRDPGRAHRREDAEGGPRRGAGGRGARAAPVPLITVPRGRAAGAAVRPRPAAPGHDVIGWLLLLPAAVLLVTFTHYPILETIRASLFSTPRATRPAVFVGLDNYRLM